jgi:hypothetical protein
VKQALPSLICGYVVSFSIKKIFDAESVRFDLEIALSEEWRPSSSVISAQFTDVRDMRYGSPHEAIDLGANLALSIDDVAERGLERMRFRVFNVEQGCNLSFYCRSFDVLDASAASS